MTHTVTIQVADHAVEKVLALLRECEGVEIVNVASDNLEHRDVKDKQ